MVLKLQHSTVSRLDAQAIVNSFGGRLALVSLLKQYGVVEITVAAVAKWVLRKHIPAARLNDIETLAKLMKKRFRLADYSTTTTKKAA